jgi:DNA-binding NarL/FixJ family response regulator
MKKYSLHLCDDHPILACSLAELLSKEPFVQSVSVSQHFDELMSALDTSFIDLLLLDISFKGVTVFEFLGKIKSTFTDVKILMLTNYELSDVILEARKFQVEGLIGKSATMEELRSACWHVLNGGEYWGKFQLSQEMIQEITPREREIMRLLVNGKTNQQIAEELSISIFTVQTHRKNIKSKLQVEGVADLIAAVNHYRLV